MTKASYYDPQSISRRIICYFGAVNDLFIDDALVPLAMREMLHRELRVNGYERIIFLGYQEGAYFLDEQSRRLWRGREKAQPSAAPRLQSPIRGRLLSGGVPAASRPARELAIDLDAREMLRYAGEFVRNDDIRTAVVITDALNLLKHLYDEGDGGSMLNHLLSQIDSITSPSNRNKIIFLFASSENDVCEFMEKDEMRGVWKTLTNRALLHHIPAPNIAEIRPLLHYLRLNGIGGKRLMMDGARVEEIGQFIASKMKRNSCMKKQELAEIGPEELSAIELKELMQFLLIRYIEPETAFGLDECKRICSSNEKTALEELDELIGMQEAKKQIKALAAAFAQNSHRKVQAMMRLVKPVKAKDMPAVNLHMAITGAPGTGKTTIARLMGRIFAECGLLVSGHLVETRPSELIGEYIGHTEAKMRDAIQRAMDGVLFIDEAYGMEDRTTYHNDYKDGMVDELNASMTRYAGQFSVIVAGYKDRIESMLANSNAGLKSRFATRIHIESYTPEELAQIFRMMAKKRGLSVSPELNAMLVSFMENWYYACQNTWENARNVENLLQNMGINAVNGLLTPETIPGEYKEYASREKQISYRQRLDEMIGLKRVKQMLKDYENELRLGDNQEMRNQHFIFAGNAGTGKTTVAELFGQLLKGAGVLKSGEVTVVEAGELMRTPGLLEKTMDECKDRVLFIDEAYQLLQAPHLMHILNERTNPDKTDFPMRVICAGYPEVMKGDFQKFNEGLTRRFDVVDFESYTADELMQIFELVWAKKKDRYTVTDEFRKHTHVHLEENLAVIQKYYNAGYVSKYMENASKLLYRRLAEAYGEEEIPPRSAYEYTADDIPEFPR